MKNKKYAITFGLATLVTPILPVALVMSCGDDTVASKQQAVDTEQAKINSLQTHAITVIDGIAASNDAELTQVLATQLGIDGFSPDPSKFSYTLSNPALTQSGPLSLTITVGDKVNPTIKGTPQALSVAVTVTSQQQIDANKNYLETVISSSLNGHGFASVIVAPDTSLVDANAQLYMAPPNGSTIALPYPDIDVKVAKAAHSTDVSYTIGGSTTFTVSFAKFAAISLAEFLVLYPGKIVDNKVVDYAFNEQLLPAGFTLPNDITTIGLTAFSRFQMSDRTLPASFAIPESVTSIENSAFNYAVLPLGFAIPQSVTLIRQYVFASTILPLGFAIPESITSIDESAFEYASVPFGFAIPKSVLTIGDTAFHNVILPVGFIISKSIASIGAGAFSHTLPTGCHWEKDGVRITDYPTEGGHDYKIVAD